MADGSHILNSMPVRAVLGRDSNYPNNGRAEIASDEDKLRRVYNNDGKITGHLEFYGIEPKSKRVGKHTPAHAALYHFEHFTTGQTPYPNNAHHLVPCDVFQEDEVFTHGELEIIRRVEYDVNNGRNVIFLPSFSYKVEIARLGRRGRPGPKVWKSMSEESQDALKVTWQERARRYCNVHRLPCHFDFHRDYTDQVKTDCEKLVTLVRSQLGKICADWTPPESIPEELHRLQDEYWGYVVKFGESRPLGSGASINALIKIKPPTGKLTL